MTTVEGRGGHEGDLQREVVALRRLVERQQERLERLERTPSSIPDASSRLTRRRLFGLAGAGVAGAAVLGHGGPALAADGGNFLLGSDNEATSVTLLENTSNGANFGMRILMSGGGTGDALRLDNEGTGRGLDAGVASDEEAIRAVNTGTGRAVFGRVDNAAAELSAIHGIHDGLGAGIHGVSALGAGGTFSGGRANLQFVPLSEVAAAGAPTTGSHLKGDVVFNDDGELWLCYAAGTPGLFRRLDGFDPGPTFLLFATPSRAFDSREDREPLGDDAGVKGQFASGEERVVDLRVFTGMPANAIAALVNLTVADTLNTGFATIYAGDQTLPNASSINWSATGLQIANTTVTAVDSDLKVKVYASNPCEVIIDVIAVYTVPGP